MWNSCHLPFLCEFYLLRFFCVKGLSLLQIVRCGYFSFVLLPFGNSKIIFRIHYVVHKNFSMIFSLDVNKRQTRERMSDINIIGLCIAICVNNHSQTKTIPISRWKVKYCCAHITWRAVNHRFVCKKSGEIHSKLISLSPVCRWCVNETIFVSSSYRKGIYMHKQQNTTPTMTTTITKIMREMQS